MVPDLMFIQVDGKIPIDLVDNGLALKSQQKEEKEGDSRQILNVQDLFSVLHRNSITEGFLALVFSLSHEESNIWGTEGPCSVIQCYVVCQVDSVILYTH